MTVIVFPSVGSWYVAQLDESKWLTKTGEFANYCTEAGYASRREAIRVLKRYFTTDNRKHKGVYDYFDVVKK